MKSTTYWLGKPEKHLTCISCHSTFPPRNNMANKHFNCYLRSQNELMTIEWIEKPPRDNAPVTSRLSQDATGRRQANPSS